MVSNGEMPPQDENVEISPDGKASIVDWLSTEIQSLRRSLVVKKGIHLSVA